MQCGFGDSVQLEVEGDRLVITRARKPREGWEEMFAAAGPSDDDELLLDGFENEFDGEEWTW